MARTGFAGVRCHFWSAGISVKALLTALAVTALRVVAAVVAHPATPSPRCEPQPSTEVTAPGVAVTLALLTLVRRPRDAVGGLPGLIVVERCAALAVVAGRVMSAGTLAVDHVADVLCAGKVGTGWFAVVGVSIAKAAAFDYKIIDGVMIRGEGRGTRMLGLAGARLILQQTDSQVGDHELVLSSRAIGIH